MIGPLHSFTILFKAYFTVVKIVRANMPKVGSRIIRTQSEIGLYEPRKVQIKRMVLWEGLLMEGLDWNDGKRQTENGIKYQKNQSSAAIFFRFVAMQTS